MNIMVRCTRKMLKQPLKTSRTNPVVKLSNSILKTTSLFTASEILVKIFRNCGNIFDILENCINQSIETSNFLDYLKMANITAVFNKGDPIEKLNYRPFIILPPIIILLLVINFMNLLKGC